MASLIPNAIKGRLLGDDSIISTAVNLKTDTLKLSLHSASYTPAAEHDFFSDLTNEVSSSGGYTAGIAGGYLLTDTISTNDTSDRGIFDATDVSIATASITARYAVIRKDTGVAATSPIIVIVDLGSNITSTAGTFAITWDAAGIMYM
jgi:hypothetical protein